MASSGLIVRRSERFEISIPSRVRVAAYHAELLHFVKGVTDADRWIEVDLIDFATGGVGFIVDVFMPRNMDLELEIPDFDDPKGGEVMLRCRMKVKRVQMTDRRPAYQIGCSFIDLDDQVQESIDQLTARLRGMAEDGISEGGQDVGYL